MKQTELHTMTFTWYRYRSKKSRCLDVASQSSTLEMGQIALDENKTTGLGTMETEVRQMHKWKLVGGQHWFRCSFFIRSYVQRRWQPMTNSDLLAEHNYRVTQAANFQFSASYARKRSLRGRVQHQTEVFQISDSVNDGMVRTGTEAVSAGVRI